MNRLQRLEALNAQVKCFQPEIINLIAPGDDLLAKTQLFCISYHWKEMLIFSTDVSFFKA